MEQNLKKRLGKRIQELRLKNGLKQATLAEKVNLAHKSQSCIETGKNYPSAEVVEKYAKALNVDVAEILDIEHIKSTKELIESMNVNIIVKQLRFLISFRNNSKKPLSISNSLFDFILT